MEFNIEEMSIEELKALEEAIAAKLAELEEDPEEREGEEGDPAEELPAEIMEIVEELPAELEKLEEMIDEIADRKRALKKSAEKRSALRKRIASGEGKTIRKFESEEKKMNYSVDSKEYRSAWLKNLQGKPLTAEERTAVTASAAIPTQTMNMIVGKAELFPLVNAVDVSYIPSNVTFPVEGTINAANWVAMGTAATDSADTIAPITLGAYKLIKTVEITADVAAMAIDAFETWLVDRLANKIMRAVAIAIAVGTGSAQATGLSSLTQTGTYTKAAITYNDIMNVIASLPTEYTPNATFVMSRTTFFGNVLGLVDSSKKPIVVADVQSPAKFNVLGFNVILEDAVGTDIYFGDLKEGYKFNFAKDVEVRNDESVAFRTGSTVYRAMCLADGKPTGVGIVRYTKSST